MCCWRLLYFRLPLLRKWRRRAVWRWERSSDLSTPTLKLKCPKPTKIRITMWWRLYPKLDDHWLHENKILTVSMIDQFPKLLLFKYCSVIGYFLNQIHRPDSFFSISKLIPNLCFFFVINTKYHDSVVAEARGGGGG